MALTKEQVEHVAKLARLALTAEETERLQVQLSSILGHVEKLQALDVSNVPPTTHAVEVESTPLRDDRVHPTLAPAEATANAPAQEDGFFVVPRILE
jgi:aspartyl-tRNA(Asn)/glutamyl-tRNA(Gln) amidotransferase subunit C